MSKKQNNRIGANNNFSISRKLRSEGKTSEEFEVMLNQTQTPADGEAIAVELMSQLGINDADLVEGAYMDLLELQEN